MTTDVDLFERDIQDLASADAVTAFFARLGWNTNVRRPQQPEHLGLDSDAARRPIRSLELVASQPDDFYVYLFHLRSVTVAHTGAVVRALRQRQGDFLLVLTSDWERIDFVFLDRLHDSSEGIAQTGAVGRPRVLSVDRRKPSPVDLRVLRRLTWTESDRWAQAEKIRGAFTVADWSEDFFNNRALFSDHYLINRLRDNEEWREDPRPAYEKLRRLYEGAASRLSKKDESTIRADLLEPTLAALGFVAKPGKSAQSTASDPDFRLYDGKGNALLALCLAYPWGRSLDAKDPDRDPHTADENPGAVVVSLLEQGEAPWVVMTNGKLWRLYSRQARSRATSYYEIDLEEVLASHGPLAAAPAEAFRYFWLLFRGDSFKPGGLLDQIREGSEHYAKDLEERLKERIFVSVFPQLARGLLSGRKTAAKATGAVSQDELDAAFHATLILLYRLLFFLYAEARDLLPVREQRGYREKSLLALRKEIADAGGPIAGADQQERIAEHYSETEFELWKRLCDLFSIVDRGDPAMNVPTYNGGLFITDPASEDTGSEAEVARYLATSRIPDRHVALALDWLGRDVDEKRQDLVFIDYKSLGVRQLGSIYEGLLEFKLRVAPEPLAIVAVKKTELYMPLREARTQSKTILREGTGRDARERVLQTGELYLENDRRERKATGSYYTPDFVVRYIVARAVGPVLEEKFVELRPNLREAERWHREAVAAAKAKGEKPGKYESGPAVEHRWSDLVDQVFNIRVLDPAMGSGHFLVEAVDYITDRLLNFLNGFGWNPVFAHAQHLRAGILAEMEERGLSIDAGKLTDVNLLKRHVLKRCIFGVDINPMAVELAKVSLWLDCFTLGAPLSFLDHHLRRGNSLLGTTVKEVDEASRTSGHALLGSAFTGRKLAVDMMVQVGAMPDVTAAQVRESRSAYSHAADALAAPQRVLDVYFCRDIVEPAVTEQPAKRGKKIVQAADSWAVQFLQDHRVSDYLWADDEQARTKYRANLKPAEREQLDRVEAEASTRALFHWELGFPEVFYGPRPGTRQTVERLQGAGFDAVVGNPPWIRQEGLKQDKQVLEHTFPEVFHSEADIYVCFLGRSLKVLRSGGRLGMLVQNKWLKAGYAEKLRTHLATAATPVEVVDFGHSPLFPDADTFPCVLLAENRATAENSLPVGFTFVKRDDLKQRGDAFDLFEYVRSKQVPVARRQLRPEGWEMMSEDEYVLKLKICGAGVPLKEYLGASPFYGIKTGLNEAFLIDETTRDRLVKEDPGCKPIIKPFLRGENISRWQPQWDGQWLIALASTENRAWPWSETKKLKEAEAAFQKAFPSLHAWMKPMEGRLKKREDQGTFWWELRSCDYYDRFERPKIVYQVIAFHSRFSVDESGAYGNDKTFILPSADPGVAAVLNSSLAWWFMYRECPHMKDEAITLQSFKLEAFPVPEMARKVCEQPARRIVQLTAQNQSKVRQFLASVSESAGKVNLGTKLESYATLDEPDFIAALKDCARKSDRPLAPTAQASLVQTWRKSRAEVRRLTREICTLEIELHHRVFDLYGLTPDEVRLLRETAPPRCPLKLAEDQLANLQDAED
jgi:hypothetical protein